MDHHKSMPDTVFDCVVPHIYDNRDRATASLVCRKWYELEGVTRKRVTISMCYSTTADRLRRRFPLLESITIKGKPRAAMFDLIPEDWGGYAGPWVRELAAGFKCLKEVHFRRMIVRDGDLEMLGRARGGELRVLRLDICSGFSTDGLLWISKFCHGLRVLFLEESAILEKNGEWLHELAVNSSVLEVLNFYETDLDKFDVKDLELLARNCKDSLVSVKVSDCEALGLGEFFRVAENVEEFGGGSLNEELEEYDGFSFPNKLRSLALNYIGKDYISLVVPVVSRLTKLDLLYALLDTEDHCFLIQRCPHLEIMETRDVIGDTGLEVVGQVCKKLRRLKIERGGADEEGLVSHRGLIALAQGCQELEYLVVNVSDIANEAFECIGTHLKRLHDFRIILLEKEEKITDLPLDNGVRAMLIGCQNLKRLGLYLRPGGLSDVGMYYLGQYSQSVRYMLLGFVGETDAGLYEFAKGCPSLQKLEMRGCSFSENALANLVMKVKTLRYFWVQGYKTSTSGRDILSMAWPLLNMELISVTRAGSNSVGDSSLVSQPPSLLAYNSLAGQRTDFPVSVIPLNPSSSTCLSSSLSS